MIFIGLVVTTPIGIYIFGGRIKPDKEGFRHMFSKYRWHFFIIIGLNFFKSFMYWLEEPMEKYATDYTMMIYGFEGNGIFWVQHYLHSYPLTLAMAFIYIATFLFIIVFSLAFLCYMNNKKAATKLIFLYVVLLLLTIPFHLFVFVYVPSYPKMFFPGAQSIVTGMEPLLYNLGPNVNAFFVGYDRFNNCFPSMHIGYPAAIIMSYYINARQYREYIYFLLAMLLLTAFAIIYLGIHWFSDIVAGFFIALIAVIISERYAHRFWRPIHKVDMWLTRKYSWWE